jgi:hypothetical protein
MDNSILLEILDNILLTKSYNDIANSLNIAVGTVKRWKLLKSVPPLYTFELMKLNKMEIDYSKFNYKEKDQFYTSNDTALYCYNKGLSIISNYDDINNYSFIEPSAGNGRFYNLMPNDKRIGIDIEPHNNGILKQDYLDFIPENGKYIVIGNPPFGLRGQLALKFINHSSQFADYVCFILPQLFESDGKGVPRKRVQGLNLIHSEKINSDFEYPDSTKIKVECIFQIWSKYHINQEYNINKIDDSIVKIVSLSDGGTPSTTRNKKMFYNCDVYLPSTCFGKDNMRYYDSFDDLPGRKGYGIIFNKNKNKNIIKFKKIDWSKVAFLSTNSAYNIRTSQIYNAIIL